MMAAWRWGVVILALAGADPAQAQAQAQTTATQPPALTPDQIEQRAIAREDELRERQISRARAVRAAEQALEHWTAQELTAFRDQDDFQAYLAAVERRERAQYATRNAHRIQFAQASTGTQSDTAQPVCGAEDKDCQLRRSESAEGQTMMVTGSRIRVVPVTNNQEQGVDEGDIVKQIGQYLLVLQDGRLFVLDTEAGPDRNGLRLVDRANVYRNAVDQAWYDELVVAGNRIVVSGYAHEADASELAVFRLGDDGRLTREGVFQIRSEDYYDRNNYASRLIGDELVLYTPLALSDRRGEGAFAWPTLRRAPDEGGAAAGEGVQLLRPEQLYRPLSTVHEPVIHMVTRCRLGEWRPGGDLACTSEGFVASRTRQFYVSGDAAYLWSDASNWQHWDDKVQDCAPDSRAARGESDRSLLHRLSLSGGPIGVVGTTGFPMDQLGMDAGNGHFRALIAWFRRTCRVGKTMPLHYFEIPDSLFSRQLRPVPDGAFTAMPEIEANQVENRFTDRHLVFGGRVIALDGSGGGDDDMEGTLGGGHAVIVPIGRPAEAQPVWLPHRVWRVERIGDNAALTGYSSDRGLEVSVIDLNGATPRLSDTLRLEGRVETEGRSHAFNSLVGADGSGLMGLPTVQRIGGMDRYAWRSAASDLSFLSVDAAGRLQSLGALAAHAQGNDRRRWYRDDDVPDDPAIYSCQVSCIDWYGNSRPLFTRGRLFALSATELIEGRVADGRIGEVQRIDLTKELPEHLRAARPGADGATEPPKE